MKIKVGVIFGGESAEHEVSIISAIQAINKINEEKYDDKEGNEVSYNPPRYNYSYDFAVTIHVNHPYFNEVTVRLNGSDIETTVSAVEENKKPIPRTNDRYCKYENIEKHYNFTH